MNNNFRSLEMRLDRIEEALVPPTDEDPFTVVIYDSATGRPCAGYEEAAAKDGVQFWLPYAEHEEGYEG